MRVVVSGLRAVAVVGLLAGCGVSSPGSEPSARGTQAIQGGSLDTTHNFAVGISIGGAGTCSGTLIAPNLVLTARHCVAATVDGNGRQVEAINCASTKFASPYSTRYFTVTTESTMGWANGGYSVSQVIVPSGSMVCGNDIALLVLSKSVTGVTPATPLVDAWMTETSKVTWQFTAIGYGVTSPSANDSGKRRIREEIDVYCVPNSPNQDCYDYPQIKDQLSENEFMAGEGVCQGDSGSGAFDQTNFTDGKYVTYGILSRGGESADGTTCAGSVYTRVDKWRQFVIDGAKTAATKGGYTAPSWTAATVGPEPVAEVKPDAGSKPDTGGGTTSKPKNLGETCTKDTDCASKNCSALSTSMPFVCTQGCSSVTACPSGFACSYNLCWEEKYVPGSSGGEPGGGGGTGGGGGGSGTTEPENPGTEEETENPETPQAPGSTVTASCAMAADPATPVPWKAGVFMLGLFGLAFRRRR